MAPPELEAVLLSRPGIVDAGEVGVQPFDGDRPEYPRAYVVRRDSDEGRKLSEDEVKKHIADRLAGYKRLDGGVVFVDEIVSLPVQIDIADDHCFTVAQESKRQDTEA